MNDRIRRVIRGWGNLNADERKEFEEQIAAIQKDANLLYFSASAMEKRLQESVDRVSLGPLGGGGCPCCGR